MFVSRMISCLYFLISCLAFFLIALHISAYTIRCLSSTFSTICCRFVIKARVGDDILYLTGLLIAIAALGPLYWIMFLMDSLMASMSSRSCSVSNRFLNLSWNSIFFDPICVVFTLDCLYVQLEVAYISIMWSLPKLTCLTIVTYVTMSSLFVTMWSISVFVKPFGLFHVHLLPAFF